MSPAAGAGGGDAVAPDYHRVRPAGGNVPPCKGDEHVTGRRAWRRCAWLNEVKPRREGTVGKIRSPRRGDGIGPTAQRW